MRNIYLVRHGEPEFNNNKPFCLGQMDIPLSIKGTKQVKLLRDYFEDKKINHIYSSSLKRCRQTAALISDKSPIIVEGLKEINMGSWDGLSFKEIILKYPDEYRERGKNFEFYVPQNGESFGQCLKRSRAAFLNIIENSNGNIIIVSHAGVNRVLLCWMLNMPLVSMFELKQPYGCFNLIRFRNGKLEVRSTGALPQKEEIIEGGHDQLLR